MFFRAVIFSIFLLLTIFTSSNGQQAVGITIASQGGKKSGMGGMMMGMMMGGMNTYYTKQYYNW